MDHKATGVPLRPAEIIPKSRHGGLDTNIEGKLGSTEVIAKRSPLPHRPAPIQGEAGTVVPESQHRELSDC